MLSVKWKIYKILNYVLLLSAVLLFLVMLTVLLDNMDDIKAYFVTCVFLLIIIQAFINLYVISKNLSYIILTGAKLKWHVTGSIINFIAFLGLLIFLWLVLTKIRERGDYTMGDVGIIILLVCGFICLIDGFILFCQFTLPAYLKKNSTNLSHSLINSIGSDTDI
jgi:hypothetical protein